MKRLVYWADKQMKCALRFPISEDGDTVPIDDICEQLATLYDVMDGLTDDEVKEALEAAREDRGIFPPVRIGEPFIASQPAKISHKSLTVQCMGQMATLGLRQDITALVN